MARNKNIDMVAIYGNVEYEAAADRMVFARDTYGIRFADFYNKKLYFKSKASLAAIADELNQTELKEEALIRSMCQATGKSDEAVLQEIESLIEKSGYKLTVTEFYDHGMHLVSEDEALEIIVKLRELKFVSRDIKKKIEEEEFDASEMSFTDEDIVKAKALISETLSPAQKADINQVASAMGYVGECTQELMTDMELMRAVFWFSYEEYISFDFQGKELNERLGYLSTNANVRFSEVLNDPYEVDNIEAGQYGVVKVDESKISHAQGVLGNRDIVKIISVNNNGNIILKWNHVETVVEETAEDSTKNVDVVAAIDDNGVISAGPFEGRQLPDWEKLKRQCAKMATMKSKVKFLEWSWVYSEKNTWELVALNPHPQLVKFQSAYGTGIRYEFIDIITAADSRAEAKDINVLQVSRKMKVPYEEALEIMTKARDDMGISFAYYNKKNLHLTNSIRLSKISELKQEQAARAEEHYKNIEEMSSMTREEVDELINKVKLSVGFGLSPAYFNNFELYKLTEEEIMQHAYKAKQVRDLSNKLKRQIRLIDKGEETFENIAGDIEVLRGYISDTLCGVIENTIIETLLEGNPSLADNLTDEQMHELTTDIRLTKKILDFGTKEYTNYHFPGKSFEERHKFLARPEGIISYNLVNDKDFSEVLDDKFRSYEVLKEAYGRPIMLIEDSEDVDAFVDFCKEVPKFVKKPISLSQGKGVELIDSSKYEDKAALLKDLYEEWGSMVLEGLIVQNEAIAAFNPDSVNTLRVISCTFGKRVELMWGLFRTGRGGNFVDNAGAGGVYADLDAKNGIVASEGADKSGRRYPVHPETLKQFKGFKLPDWDQATKLIEKNALAMPKMKIIGWDLAYDANGKWVVVECNSHPEFGHQGAADKGRRKEFLDAVDEIIRISKHKSIPQRIVRKLKRMIKG